MTAGDELRFLVSAAPAPQANLTVGVTIASDPCDLTEPPDSVIIGAGESQGTLKVETRGLTEGCVVTATITAGDGYEVGEGAGAAASATLTMQPVVTIAADASRVAEGSPVSFTLTAAPAPAADLTVNVSWSDPGSFLIASGSGTVTIPASDETATLTAHTDDDSTAEDDGSVTVTVRPGSGYTVGARKSATIDVTDNDDPTTRSPGPSTPGPATPAPRTPGPATPGPRTPSPTTPAPTPEPPTPTVTISAPGATRHWALTHAMVVEVDEGDTVSFTLEATPTPESALTVNLSWSFAGDLASPPVNTDLSLTPRPDSVTIPTSGTASFTLTAGNNNKKNHPYYNGHLISIWPGDGYTYDVPRKLFVHIEDDD